MTLRSGFTRKSTIIIFSLFMIAAFFLFSVGCDGGGDGSGTLTIKYEGDGSLNESQLLVKVIAGGGDNSDDPVLAAGSGTINNGVAEITLKVPESESNPPSGWAGTDTIWRGTKDTTYDVYFFIDGNGDGKMWPDDGDYEYTDEPVTYTQNGDKVIETVFEDYEEYVLII